MVLIGSEKSSTTEKVGDGFKVTTAGIKDVANPGVNTATQAESNTAVGYCTFGSLPGFRLDPPRGKPMRYAVALFNKKDEEGLHIHKLEYIEPDQISNASKCIQKLRKLCTLIHPESAEKRSRSIFLDLDLQSSASMKKARVLRAVPTDASLDDNAS